MLCEDAIMVTIMKSWITGNKFGQALSGSHSPGYITFSSFSQARVSVQSLDISLFLTLQDSLHIFFKHPVILLLLLLLFQK